MAKGMREAKKLRLEKTASKNIELEREFADVFHYLLNLANRFDIDLEKAFREKALVNQKRKWDE